MLLLLLLIFMLSSSSNHFLLSGLVEQKTQFLKFKELLKGNYGLPLNLLILGIGVLNESSGQSEHSYREGGQDGTVVHLELWHQFLFKSQLHHLLSL